MRTLHYAIVFVKDMKKSIAFYQDVLGLALKFESPEWSEFVTGQATVALHKAQADSTGREQGQAGRCQIGFHVTDLDAFHKDVMAKGVVCVLPPKQEHFGKIAVYADLDGLCITILQPAQGQA